MMNLETPIRGLVAGFIIAAPVGPVNVLCIQRTIEKGWSSGIFSGMGAAAADSIYGAAAVFSISFVIQFLIRERFWLRLIGGALLILIGIWYYRRKPLSLAEQVKTSERSDLISTFLLTLMNPTTVLSFMAVLTGLGLSQHGRWSMSLLLIGGIFTGSMVWWLTLATVVSCLRKKITDPLIVWTNRIGGIAIGAFGVVNIILARAQK